MLGFRSMLALLRDQHTLMAGILARHVDVERERVALERERFAWERERAERDDARRRAWEQDLTGGDLPDVVSHAITTLAHQDAALRTQLVKWARARLAAQITPDTVAKELLTGIPAKTL